MRFFKLYGIGFVLALHLGVDAPHAFAENGVTKDEIHLGFIGAFTGPIGFYGVRMSSAANVYYDKINKAGGVHGRKIKLISLDDAYDPEKAIQHLKQLAEKDKVFAIIGGTGTPVTKACVPGLKKYDTFWAFPFAAGEHMYDPSNNRIFYNIRQGYTNEAEALVEFALKKLKQNDFGVFYQDDAFGIAGRSGVQKTLAKNGLSLKMSASYRRNDESNAEALEAFLKAKPKVLFMQSIRKNGHAFLKQIFEKGYKPIVLAISTFGTFETRDAFAGSDAEIYTSEVLPIPSEAQNLQLVKEYFEDMKAAGKPKEETESIGFEGYMGAAMFVEAAKRAGPDLTRDKWRAAFMSLKNVNIGGFDVNVDPSTNTAFKHIYIYKSKSGQTTSVQ